MQIRISPEDEKYMRMALDMAEKGSGYVNPNPLVGSVIVKDGQVIAKGFHERYGELHAERNAIKNATEPIEGATIYVTLEPCCHYGKTPPCTEAIIENGIKRVVVGAMDPNPLVNGKGINILNEHGISVTTGVLEEECLRMNEVFFHYVKTGLPFVVLKYAMTLDGKIASSSGKSKWISGEESRHFVHELRHRYMGIMVGIGTVLADDPELTCRIDGLKNPYRIICDTNLQIPITSKIVQTADEIPTFIATVLSPDSKKAIELNNLGCNIISLPESETGLNLKELMKHLAALKIDSILLEGGAEMNYSMLKEKLVQKAYVFIAPKILGGRTAKTPVAGMGLDDPNNAFRSVCKGIRNFGEDIMLEMEMDYSVYRDC